MPTDTRRNAAPEKRENYFDFVNTADLNYENVRKILLHEAGIRRDGRKHDEHRKICKLLHVYHDHGK